MAQGRQIKEILEEMAQQKMRETWRLQEAYQVFLRSRPALAEAEHVMVRGRLQAARGQLDPQAADALAQTFADQRQAALREAGLPEDAFDYQPRCPHCQDTGMVGAPIQHPCSCVIRRLAGRIHEASGLDPQKCFSRFDASLFEDRTPLPHAGCTQRAYMERLRDRALAYCEKFPALERPHWLLEGGTGLGKTYLMHCIGNALADRGFTVLLTSAYQLNQAVLSSWDADRLDLFLGVDLLLIDDLGAEPLLQKVTGETLFTLVNERQNASRAVILSTNLNRADIARRYGERFLSRITDRRCASVFLLEGGDLRQR